MTTEISETHLAKILKKYSAESGQDLRLEDLHGDGTVIVLRLHESEDDAGHWLDDGSIGHVGDTVALLRLGKKKIVKDENGAYKIQ